MATRKYTNRQASDIARRTTHPMLAPGTKLPVALSNALGRIVARQVKRSSLSPLDKELRRYQLRLDMGQGSVL